MIESEASLICKEDGNNSYEDFFTEPGEVVDEE